MSNILCSRHNQILSKYDTEAGRLHNCILKFDADFNSPSPKNDVIQINGDYIEKWMLKTICGLVASKQIAMVKTIVFTWVDKKYDKWLELRRVSSSKEHPENWESWMKK